MKQREVWLDALRIVSAFLVIVNHTNSQVFQGSDPAQLTWWLSILWYALCKVAVPVFVMVSGACLLGRADSYGKCLWRFARIVLALVVFSYLYFLHDAWVYYGLWPRAVDLRAFFTLVWQQKITDSFWYLYFYAALMLMLPLLQRLSLSMRGHDALYLMGLCFGFDALWPLITRILPGLALPSYFDAPLFTSWIGLFFAGWQIRSMRGRAYCMPALLLFIASLAVGVLSLHVHYVPGEKYWAFMDDRMHPGFWTILAAIALMVLARGLCDRPRSQKAQRVWSELGGCAFGIYLLQDWLIAQSEARLFVPLQSVLPVFPAVIVWEIAVFGVALAAAYVMRRIPLLKKIV